MWPISAHVPGLQLVCGAFREPNDTRFVPGARIQLICTIRPYYGRIEPAVVIWRLGIREGTTNQLINPPRECRLVTNVPEALRRSIDRTIALSVQI